MAKAIIAFILLLAGQPPPQQDPSPFAIDAHGVLQNQSTGNASLEGTLKKLLAMARASQPAHSRRHDDATPEEKANT